MNKIFRYIGCILFTGLAMTACSPDEFEGMDGNLPLLSDYKAKVTVDQENNVATFEMVTKDGGVPEGVYPIWAINTGSEIKSTENGYKTDKIIVAGTYSYTMKVANRNGICDAEESGTFTINTTRYDFSSVLSTLTGDASKEWRVYSIKPGHLACGSAHDKPTEWWEASPNEKAAEGIYDDAITFTKTESPAGGNYAYSAGEDGNTFLNEGITVFGAGPGADWSFPCVGKSGAVTEGGFTLTYNADRDEVGIVLPAKYLFPYMANDAQFNSSMTYWITDLNDKTMTVVLDFAGISWQMIFVNGENEDIEEEFDPELVNWTETFSQLNIANTANAKGTMTFYWANAGWGQTADPGFSFADGVYTVTCAATGGSEWMGQCSIHNIATEITGGEYYDYSFTVEAMQANDLNLTFKFAEEGNDNNNASIYKAGIKVEEGVNVIRFAKILAGQDISNAVLFFDLGSGSQEGEVYKFSNIVVQKHNPK